jgi:transketolase
MDAIRGALTGSELKALAEVALQTRLDVLSMIAAARSGHIGSTYSSTDILVLLYARFLDHGDERVRICLSKGHAAPAVYSLLKRVGALPADLDLAAEFRRAGGLLQGHPALQTPGVDVPSGSLGMGLSAGVGIALSNRLRGSDAPVFVVLGDGELNEGQVWEAAMSAAHYRLSRLVAIVDRNAMQCSGRSSEVMGLASLPARWESFGWRAVECDGHDFVALDEAIRGALQPGDGVAPTVIVAATRTHRGIASREGALESYGEGLTDGEIAEFKGELLNAR